MILIADLGATNARFCVTKDGKSYFLESIYKINDFDSLEQLCSKYISDNNLDELDKGIIGVAAPILGDKVVFVNADLEFRISAWRFARVPCRRRSLGIGRDQSRRIGAHLDVSCRTQEFRANRRLPRF